jgi:hypothetical protein
VQTGLWISGIALCALVAATARAAQIPAATIIQRFAPRDAFDVNRDNVGFTLDTSGDGRYGFWMNLSLGDLLVVKLRYRLGS